MFRAHSNLEASRSRDVGCRLANPWQLLASCFFQSTSAFGILYDGPLFDLCFPGWTMTRGELWLRRLSVRVYESESALTTRFVAPRSVHALVSPRLHSMHWQAKLLAHMSLERWRLRTVLSSSAKPKQLWPSCLSHPCVRKPKSRSSRLLSSPSSEFSLEIGWSVLSPGLSTPTERKKSSGDLKM